MSMMHFRREVQWKVLFFASPEATSIDFNKRVLFQLCGYKCKTNTHLHRKTSCNNNISNSNKNIILQDNYTVNLHKFPKTCQNIAQIFPEEQETVRMERQELPGYDISPA